MQISDKGIEALKEHEGCRLQAYRDTGGVWTFGYGTIRTEEGPVHEGQQCTSEEAENYLRNDLIWAEDAVNALVHVELNQGQFDALVSFTYNLGAEALRKSTLLRILNEGDYAGAAKQFDRWVYDNGVIIRGLIARRRVEREMFEA